MFVPLCGKSLDLLWLAGQGHPVLGVEISPVGVESFFQENGLKPQVTDAPPFRRYQVDELTVLCGDFFALTPGHLQGVTAVFDRASLIALPPELRPRYAEHLQGLLRPETRILLVTLDYDQAEMAGPPFSVGEDEVRKTPGRTLRHSPPRRAGRLGGESPLSAAWPEPAAGTSLRAASSRFLSGVPQG